MPYGQSIGLMVKLINLWIAGSHVTQALSVLILLKRTFPSEDLVTAIEESDPTK